MANDEQKQPNLDGPPPPAPDATRRAPEESAMAPSMGASFNAATLPQAVIERAMLAEQALTSLATVAPALTPAVAQMIDLLRASVAGQLQGGQQPQLAGMPQMMGAPAQPMGPGAPPSIMM